jgi:hypothetical protein
MIKVVELGPFGSRIDHGLIEDLDEIPENYSIRWTEETGDKITKVVIEPYTE